MLVLIRVFHTICWKVFNVPLMQLREFFLVRYYLSLQLTTDLELAKSKSFLFERNSTIALPSAALPYLYSWAGVDCLNMSYGPSSLPHGNLSFPAILCLSWSEGFRFFPLSLRIAIVEIRSGLELLYSVFSWPTIGGCWKRRKGKVVLKRDCYQS